MTSVCSSRGKLRGLRATGADSARSAAHILSPRAGLAHLGRLVLRQAKAHSAGTGVPGMALLQGLHSLDLGGLVRISDEGV